MKSKERERDKQQNNKACNMDEERKIKYITISFH